MAGPTESPAFEWQPQQSPARPDPAPTSSTAWRSRVIVGSVIGLLCGVAIRNWWTAPGEDAFFVIVLIPIVAVLGLVGLLFALILRSRDLLLGTIAFAVGVGVGGFLGPDNPDARHFARGTASISTIPDGFRWSGDARCLWEGARLAEVDATVSSDQGSYRVYLALSKIYGPAGPGPIDGSVGVGNLGAYSASYETRLTDATAEADRRSGTARSGMFPFAHETDIPLGPFPGSYIVFGWTCERP
jgi:hypothetical protein